MRVVHAAAGDLTVHHPAAVGSEGVELTHWLRHGCDCDALRSCPDERHWANVLPGRRFRATNSLLVH
jgi:hypothetical protein